MISVEDSVNCFSRNQNLAVCQQWSTSYDIRQRILFWFKKMIHIHVASDSPTGCCYMTQSGTYEHQGFLLVGKSADCFCPTFNLTVEALNSFIGLDAGPILRRNIHIGQGFFDSVLHLFGGFGKLHKLEFFRYMECFFTVSFLAHLCMDPLEHKSYRFHLIMGCNRKYISVKMNGTALISGIRKDFRVGFKHAEIIISNNQTYSGQLAFFQPHKERTPAFTILFHTFLSANDLLAAALTDANSNKDRKTLDPTDPTTLQVDNIYINIG